MLEYLMFRADDQARTDGLLITSELASRILADLPLFHTLVRNIGDLLPMADRPSHYTPEILAKGGRKLITLVEIAQNGNL